MIHDIVTVQYILMLNDGHGQGCFFSSGGSGMRGNETLVSAFLDAGLWPIAIHACMHAHMYGYL